MRKALLFGALSTALALTAIAAPVAAAKPLDVTIVNELTIYEGEPTVTAGPFVASGPAVDAGIICAEGTSTDVFDRASGFGFLPDGSLRVNVQMKKRFDCTDGSGSFYAKLQVRIDRKGDKFNWVIIDGDGDYGRLRGSGKGVGIWPMPPDILDTYEGKLHLD